MKLPAKLKHVITNSHLSVYRSENGPWGQYSLHTPWFSFGVGLMPPMPARQESLRQRGWDRVSATSH